MTNDERADVVEMLKKSANEYLSAIDVNESQWHWKPAPERWSIGQTAEHIVQAEVVIFRRLQVAVQSPKNRDWEARTAGKDDLLRRVMLDRTQKAAAPATTRPQGLSKEETVRRFRELRAQVITFADETQIPLKEYTAEHPFPVFNTLNAYQWLLLVPLHHMRHHLQIGEIKASLGYPT